MSDQLSMTMDQFRQSVIAQSDDNDYQESGWVAGVHDGTAYLARYSHCSCYGTFDCLSGQGMDGANYEQIYGLTVDWIGTPEELKHMAAERLDPAMPSRQSAPDDYDYDHLMTVYAKLMETLP